MIDWCARDIVDLGGRRGDPRPMGEWMFAGPIAAMSDLDGPVPDLEEQAAVSLDR
jgi:hypothetical protein